MPGHMACALKINVPLKKATSNKAIRKSAANPRTGQLLLTADLPLLTGIRTRTRAQLREDEQG